jgi:two-component system, NarL family, nitrate/nitrite response regulator NarL
MIPEPISLVIVESQPLMLTALSTAFSAEGMTILAEISKNRDALQIAVKLNPDLILFSVGHPGLDDLERISALRQKLPAASIVALISGELRGQFQAALDYGAHLVLSKTASRSDLLSAIQGMFQKKTYPATVQAN